MHARAHACTSATRRACESGRSPARLAGGDADARHEQAHAAADRGRVRPAARRASASPAAPTVAQRVASRRAARNLPDALRLVPRSCASPRFRQPSSSSFEAANGSPALESAAQRTPGASRRACARPAPQSVSSRRRPLRADHRRAARPSSRRSRSTTCKRFHRRVLWRLARRARHRRRLRRRRGQEAGGRAVWRLEEPQAVRAMRPSHTGRFHRSTSPSDSGQGQCGVHRGHAAATDGSGQGLPARSFSPTT